MLRKPLRKKFEENAGLRFIEQFNQDKRKMIEQVRNLVREGKFIFSNE